MFRQNTDKAYGKIQPEQIDLDLIRITSLRDKYTKTYRMYFAGTQKDQRKKESIS
jgi:hypothetical protein